METLRRLLLYSCVKCAEHILGGKKTGDSSRK